jgi:hypothetical protein
VLSMMVFTCWLVREGFAEIINPASPATSGEARDVPLAVVYVLPIFVVASATPGATTLIQLP